MAWPPASSIGSGLGYTGTLPVTLAWGTDGLYSQSAVTVVVTSMRPADIVEEILIEQGSGIVSQQVLILQGKMVEITFLDDRSITTWPTPGTVLTLNSPLPNGAGATSTTYEVVDNSYQATRKAPGERTFLAKHFTLFAPAAL